LLEPKEWMNEPSAVAAKLRTRWQEFQSITEKLLGDGWQVMPTLTGLAFFLYVSGSQIPVATKGPSPEEEQRLRQLGINDRVQRLETRTLLDVYEAESEACDRAWYAKNAGPLDDPEGEGPFYSAVRLDMLDAKKAIEEKFGIEALTADDELELAYLNGHLSALRWVLGSEWDRLCTCASTEGCQD
jgi:hypothetical protein